MKGPLYRKLLDRLRKRRHHPVFKQFSRVNVTGTGEHVFDFLGTRTKVKYKRAWRDHALPRGVTSQANYPKINEHYFDWISILRAVRNAGHTFRMAELGAGWGPWLVAASKACNQCQQIQKRELLGIEANLTHYQWMLEHFADNGVDLNPDMLLYGAISIEEGLLRFPKIENPDLDYGASLRSVGENSLDYVEVKSYRMNDLLQRFSGPIDFMHIDIQGAEYQVIPNNMKLIQQNVKSLMIGTHISSMKHNELTKLMTQAGWKNVLNFPRNERSKTSFGVVDFDDGFQLWQNLQKL